MIGLGLSIPEVAARGKGVGVVWVPGTYYDIANGDAPPSVARTSAATYFNSSGILATASANTARVTYDPLTLERLGLLIEDKDGANSLFRSTNLSVSWGLSGSTASVDTAEVTDPAGGNVADIALEQATTSNHQWSQAVTFSALAADTVFTSRFILKQRDRGRVLLLFSNNLQMVVDLAIGEIDATYTSNDVKVVRTFCRRLANGWVEAGMQHTVLAGATTFTLLARQVTTGQTTSYTGDVTKGTYHYHAQVRSAQIEEFPIITTSTPKSRDQDVVTESIASWWGSERSIMFEGRSQRSSGACIIAQVDDGSESNRVRFWRDASGNGRILVTAGGAEQANLDLGTWQNNTDRAVCFSLTATELRCSMNGRVVLTASIATPPSGLTTLRYGLDSSGVGPNTIIRRKGSAAYKVQDNLLQSSSLKRVSRDIWCIGDSITAGNATGVTQGYNYPAQLARLMSRRYFNSGVGGETSTQIMTRFIAENDRLNWLTIIEAGRNDGSAQSTILANIADMVAHLPSNARYLVMSIPFANNDAAPTLAYIAAENAALASTYGVRFIAVDWSTVTRVADQLHPDDAGNATLAAIVQAKINALGW